MFLQHNSTHQELNRIRYLERLRDERINIQYMLETYHMFITYAFYIILLAFFLLLFTSVFTFVFKKVVKSIWKILSSDFCMCLFGLVATLTGFLIIGLTAYEIMYDSYLWHNDKMKYQENLTLRELLYTNEMNYL